MTQTPPVSPDFATPPKELVDRASRYLREHDSNARSARDLAREFAAIATLSHAAGRAEGLAMGLKNAAWRVEKMRDAFMHENFSYDPSTGAWEGTTAQEEYVETLDSVLEAIGAPAPAPGLAAQEVEAATHAYIAINLKGEVRAYCADDPGEKESTEAILSQWIGMGRSIERLPIAEARSRALSAPRPAQAKEGETE